MRITLTADGAGEERRAELVVSRGELAAAHLNLAFPEGRNRTGLYMRRHGDAGGVGPNAPLRSAAEPPKLTIPEHLAALRRAGALPDVAPPPAGSPLRFALEPAVFVVPVSDLVANLLRPAFHRDGLGPHRLFFFDGEPVRDRAYWCACFWRPPGGPPRLDLRWVRFDPDADRALDPGGADLAAGGLVWAAALVPLVVDGRALTAPEIAPFDYDLRHFLGRESEDLIREVYRGWTAEWDRLAAAAVREHAARGLGYATFFHSVLGIDAAGGLVVRQASGDLPGLAAELAADGVVAAGLLDSGGSCALYDAWLGGYLLHSWYHRLDRGSVMALELTRAERIPRDQPGSWIRRRER